MQAQVCKRGLVSGRVQGVGFRYFVTRHAQAEGIHGYVRNLADGRVEFVVQGETAAVARLLETIRRGPAHARVDALALEDIAAAQKYTDFSVLR